MLTTILATIVVLGILIFVHELGHFVTAKLVDIRVPRFSIGLGPKLWGFRRGETEYVISWLPLGGYVQMAGMEEMEMIEGRQERPVEGMTEATGIAGASDLGLMQEVEDEEAEGPERARDFESKSLPARFLVISAGVIMNFLFAILVFGANSMIWGVEEPPDAVLPEIPAEELPAGAEALAGVRPGSRVIAVNGRDVNDWGDVRVALLTASPGAVTMEFEDAPPATLTLPANDTARAEFVVAIDPGYPPIIGQVVDGSPAERAGLRPGDRVLGAAGQPVRRWSQLVTIIQDHPGQPMRLTLERSAEILTIEVVPAAEQATVLDEQGEVVERTVGRIGAAVQTPRERLGPVAALGFGVARVGDVTGVIVGFLGDLFTGDASPRSLGGPIMIGQISGEVARAGAETFLNFLALFSVNLAVLNLLPIPVLDGGHLMFLLFEAVRGRPLSQTQRMRLTQIGFLIVVGIMVWAIGNDVLRLFGL